MLHIKHQPKYFFYLSLFFCYNDVVRRITCYGLGVNSGSSFSPSPYLTFVDVLFELEELFSWFCFPTLFLLNRTLAVLADESAHLVLCILSFSSWCSLNIRCAWERMAAVMKPCALIITRSVCLIYMVWRNNMEQENKIVFDITWICSKGTSKLNDSL